MTAAPTLQRFPIELGRRSRPLLRLFFRVRPDNAYVDLGEDLEARFGIGHLRTPLSNVSSWRIEGPWLWITAIGIRRSLRHADFTFGGNHRGGVRRAFRAPGPAVGVGVAGQLVTVEDPAAFTATLVARGIHGEDARRTAGDRSA